MKKLIVAIIIILAGTTGKAQQNFTHHLIDSIISLLNTNDLKSFSFDTTYRDHTEKEEYSFDKKNELVRVTTQTGNYHGRVNGHLITINVYYFISSEFVFMESIVKSFSNTQSSNKYYITDINLASTPRKERKTYQNFISRASIFRSKAKEMNSRNKIVIEKEL